MTRYATIDLYSGFVWWVGDANDPADACRKSDIEANNSPRDYEQVTASDVRGGASGFAVYEVPSGFDVDDGQDEDAIAATQTHPLAGYYQGRDE